jgi:SAM-dependent methyltransferase
MKVTDLNNTTRGRYFINTHLLPRLASGLKNESTVLFVGTDTGWDYKSLFFNPSKLCDFKTLDLKEGDIVGDISECPQILNDSYDLVVLIGVYEFVNNDRKPLMFQEIHRILKPTGKAMLSLPGQGYYESPDNHVKPHEIWEKIFPLKPEEIYVIEDSLEKGPTSIHIVACRNDFLAGNNSSVAKTY